MFSAGTTISLQAHADPILCELLSQSLILNEDWEQLPEVTQKELGACTDRTALLQRLVLDGLLTRYQADRIAAEKIYGLVLGNYRILDRLGAGAMGVVFHAEHRRLRCPVAIKVLPIQCDDGDMLLNRFYSEMRSVAQLRHPHIVGAMDAGVAHSKSPNEPTLHYFVMEYIPGQDLEELVLDNGPLPLERACKIISQIAGALEEAQKYDLVHRDVKPSNIRVTPDGKAKLLDFGLVRRLATRLTEPGTVLGTLDYLAPEQALDASTVDIRADIYGLGGTLFWCLTGKTPFPSSGHVMQDVLKRLTQSPPSVHEYRRDLPQEVDAVLARLMACKPEDRYSTPQAVIRVVEGLAGQSTRPNANSAQFAFGSSSVADSVLSRYRVLVVDDSLVSRRFVKSTLAEIGISCDEAADAEQALAMISTQPYDLIVTDCVMPGMSGMELCQKLRKTMPCPNVKIIAMSGSISDDTLTEMLSAGADDYLTKNQSPVHLVARVKAALRQKFIQDDAACLNRRLSEVISELQGNLTSRDSDLLKFRNALVLGMTTLVEQRQAETGAHLLRLQRYCRQLAIEAAEVPAFADRIDSNFVEMLQCCVPLHDIGNIALPDHVLQKPGRFDVEDRMVMQTHTVIGADALNKVVERYGPSMTFLQMAIEIVRWHHEHYDGTGYPDGLKGDDIPLAARIVMICDRYDALRSRRLYRPGLSHATAMQVMTNKDTTSHFDPQLHEAFCRCSPEFDQIYRSLPDGTAF